ncbi:MAG: ceramidase domain-containing protein [Deltaproteobacteria bacterium]|nr:ceramidase domain-containing protein [Deltaproteobacteria bacterium]
MMTVPPLPEGCPWADWTPPNIDWCEENLCAWVVNPAGTWSNLAYVLFGLWMTYSLRRHPDPLLRAFGPVAIVVGLLSGIFHASYTFFFQFFDFVAMFLFAFLPLVLNLRRLGAVSSQRGMRWYLGGVIGMSALVPVGFALELPIQMLVFVLILVIVGQEVYLRVKKLPATALGLFVVGLILLGAGATFSALDLSRVYCDPTDHVFQGHAYWHILTATSLWVMSIFYGRQPVGGGPGEAVG